MAISDLIEEKRKVSVASRPSSTPNTKGGWVTSVVKQSAGSYNPYGAYNPYGPAYGPQPQRAAKDQTGSQKPTQTTQSKEPEDVRVVEKRPSWVDELMNRIRKIGQPQEINYPKKPQRDTQIPYNWMIPQIPLARNVPAPYSWYGGVPRPFQAQRGWNVYGQRLSALADYYNRGLQPYQQGWNAYGQRLTSQAADWLSRINQMQSQPVQQTSVQYWPWQNYWGWGGGGGGGGWYGGYSESLRNWYNALMNWRI